VQGEMPDVYGQAFYTSTESCQHYSRRLQLASQTRVVCGDYEMILGDYEMTHKLLRRNSDGDAPNTMSLCSEGLHILCVCQTRGTVDEQLVKESGTTDPDTR
jgi:hypothetical protein